MLLVLLGVSYISGGLDNSDDLVFGRSETQLILFPSLLWQNVGIFYGTPISITLNAFKLGGLRSKLPYLVSGKYSVFHYLSHVIVENLLWLEEWVFVDIISKTFAKCVQVFVYANKLIAKIFLHPINFYLVLKCYIVFIGGKVFWVSSIKRVIKHEHFIVCVLCVECFCWKSDIVLSVATICIKALLSNVHFIISVDLAAHERGVKFVLLRL